MTPLFTGMIAALSRVPPWVWRALAIAGAIAGIWWWHNSEVAQARRDGAAAQKALDDAAVTSAATGAERAQAALAAALAQKQAIINERTDHALRDADDAVARAAADKRRLHEKRQADRRLSGADQAAAVPGAASGDNETYCTATGWIPFGRALTMATDAERDANQARQCAAWVAEQQAAWPQELLNETAKTAQN